MSIAQDVSNQRSKPDNYLTHSRGFLSWALTQDHKRIGLMYMVFVLSAFLLGGTFAVLLRTSLLTPNHWMFPSDTLDKALNVANDTKAKLFYNNMFSLHGAVMVFMFIIPAIPAILGNFMLPLMLGAKDVAFPRVNLLSFYIYVLGATFFTWVLMGGILRIAFNIHLPFGYGLDTGWTFYTPFSTSKAEDGMVAGVLGAFILGFSSILTGVNFIATIHTLRPRGMTWFRMPLFLWALYATSIIQILATPVLAITLLLLVAERLLHVGIFDSSLGGDPVLFQHFFWFYSHPAVYIMILPGMGVISEIVSVHSRKHIFGYSFIALSSVALALLGFLVWGHHLFVAGQSNLADSIFSLLTFSVAIPSAVKVFNWLGTLYRGSIRFTPAMVFALGFILLFTVGGLTGLFLGALATDVPLHDTYFVIAHFHYVMVGSMVFAFLGGMYHWFPKMFGKMCNQNWGRAAAIMLFIGFNITFFPQFVMGAHGSPRRWATYPAEFQPYHVISTIGAYIMAISLITVALNWLAGLLWGKPAPANPWGGNSLEWHTSSPPPHDNFPTAPVVDDPYNLGAWEYDASIEGWVPRKTEPGTAPADRTRPVTH
jgi:cytochrome c oxidase subunit 1